MSDYRILDEPRPSAASRLAVNPLWPLLGVMLGGSWLAWPWFVLNGYAVGSPTWRREIAWAVAGFLGTAALVAVLLVAVHLELVSGVGIEYAAIGLVVWKLYVTYRLFLMQGRIFELYRYFGGVVRNGMVVVVLGFMLRRPLLAAMPDLVRLILS